MRGSPDMIVGKTISGVIIKKSNELTPPAQLFLIFNDDTYYEFWVGEDGDLHAASGIDRGGAEKVRNYMSGMNIVFEKLMPSE